MPDESWINCLEKDFQLLQFLFIDTITCTDYWNVIEGVIMVAKDFQELYSSSTYHTFPKIVQMWLLGSSSSKPYNWTDYLTIWTKTGFSSKLFFLMVTLQYYTVNHLMSAWNNQITSLDVLPIMPLFQSVHLPIMPMLLIFFLLITLFST